MQADNTADAHAIAQRRLAWRCRRGMLELDIILQRFIANHFNALSMAELKAFDAMLDLPDSDFWQQITDTSATHENSALASVLGKIRAL